MAAYGLAAADGRILLTRLTAITTRPGWWTLPGGGIDHGEHPRAALVRELVEETGLAGTVGEVLDVDSSHVVAASPAGVLEDYHVVRIVFRVEVPTGEEPRVTEVDGTTDLARWVPFEEAEQLPLVELARAALHRAQAEDEEPAGTSKHVARGAPTISARRRRGR